MLDFEIRPTPSPCTPAERAALLADPGFGRVFSDHMVTIRHGETKGWFDPRVEPFGPLSLSPATAALHYAQEMFEGLKAHAGPDGTALLFRPDANGRRFNTTATRLAMPTMPTDLFLASLRHLVDADRAWVPERPGDSLYLRPFMLATDPFLGVRPSSEYLFVVIASPSRSYFTGDGAPIRAWVSRDYIRAAVGGTGAVKASANYAVSLAAQAQAIEAGCEQVVFLDAATRTQVEEAGSNNLFFALDGDDGTVTLLTPPLGGSILPGITRDSILQLARRLGYATAERPYTVAEWRTDAASGRLREVLACGTGVVITSIGTVRDGDDEFTMPGDGSIARRVRDALLDIQCGRAEDPYNWLLRV
jgi:branched-chain amino acid aminotransferase